MGAKQEAKIELTAFETQAFRLMVDADMRDSERVRSLLAEVESVKKRVDERHRAILGGIGDAHGVEIPLQGLDVQELEGGRISLAWDLGREEDQPAQE